MNRFEVAVLLIAFCLLSTVNTAPAGGSSYGGGSWGSAGTAGVPPTMPPGIPPEIAALIKSKLTSKISTSSVPAGPGGTMVPVGMPSSVANLIKGLIDANTALV